MMFPQWDVIRHSWTLIVCSVPFPASMGDLEQSARQMGMHFNGGTPWFNAWVFLGERPRHDKSLKLWKHNENQNYLSIFEECLCITIF